MKRKLKPITKAKRLNQALTSELITLRSQCASYLGTIRQQSASLDAARRDTLADEQLNRLRYILADIVATYDAQLPPKVADEIRNASAYGVAARPVRPTRLRDVVVRNHDRIFGVA